MGDKALKTDDAEETNLEAEVTDETTEVTDGDDEVEIVVEGEEQPSSKTVPVGYIKRINKLNGKINAAEGTAEELRQQNLMLQAENDLYKTKAHKATELNPDDFDSDAEFEAAKIRQELPGLVEKKAKALLAEQAQATSQTASNETLATDLRAHYDRADQLKVSDYEATEDAAIDVLGNDLAKQIMIQSEKSQVLMYYLGKNPAKAEALKRLFESPTTVVKGVLELGRLEVKLKPQSKRSSAPDPETVVEGGGGITKKSVSPFVARAKFE